MLTHLSDSLTADLGRARTLITCAQGMPDDYRRALYSDAKSIIMAVIRCGVSDEQLEEHVGSHNLDNVGWRR